MLWTKLYLHSQVLYLTTFNTNKQLIHLLSWGLQLWYGHIKILTLSGFVLLVCLLVCMSVQFWHIRMLLNDTRLISSFIISVSSLICMFVQLWRTRMLLIDTLVISSFIISVSQRDTNLHIDRKKRNWKPCCMIYFNDTAPKDSCF